MTRMTLAVIAFALALTGCSASVSSRPTSTPTKTVTVTATPDPVDSVDGHGDHFTGEEEPGFIRVNARELYRAVGATKYGAVRMPDESWCEIMWIYAGENEIAEAAMTGEDLVYNGAGNVGVLWAGTNEVDCTAKIEEGLRDFVP